MNNHPIGIFDSGLGGLSVWQELIKILPQESLIYYADSAHCPYGQKSASEIITLSEHIVDFLLEKGCKIIVVACNTATAAAIHHLREKYEVAFIGMEPAIKPAALNTLTGKVGVLATQGTLNGALFKQTKEKFANGVEVFTQVGYGLVELVENGQYTSQEAENLLREYIQPMIDKQIDQLVLGCTHYPFFIPIIEQITHGEVTIVNASVAVAKRVKDILLDKALQADEGQRPQYSFYTSGELALLKNLVSRIFPEGEYQVFQKIL
ncbi:MAG: glutamate racemase [Microscillaceae bacterium]|nr:glutamate racemase [Microscillaceae bacterium]